MDGQHFEGAGTSAAAPIFAAIIALVNDALLADGKPPLGFLNPWLYTTARNAFTDVTVGSSFGELDPRTLRLCHELTDF